MNVIFSMRLASVKGFLSASPGGAWTALACRAISRRRSPDDQDGVRMKVLQITPERCTGCMRCELACSYAQTGTFQPARAVIRVSPFERHTSYAPYTCPQCAEGWCMTAWSHWTSTGVFSPR